MSARVLLLDNYDSFVGNLYQYLGELGAEPILRRNDAITIEEARDLDISHLVISPGPRIPRDAGVSEELVRAFAGVVPILGVCLGHQAIGTVFGARVVRAKRLVHGKASPVHHLGEGVLRGVPSPFTAGRYHSLALDRESLPRSLDVTAWTDDGEVMGVRHRGYSLPRVEGVQFHPESILTEHGHRIIENFLIQTEPMADGLFETILVRGGRPVLLEPHLRRLGYSCAASRHPTVPHDLAERCRAVAEGHSCGRMRVALIEGAFHVEVHAFEGYPEEVYRRGGVATLAAGHPLGPSAGHKVLPYDPLMEAREGALRSGAFEVIFTDRDGALLEGSVSNLFIVRDGALLTPPLSRGILPGVTRGAVLTHAGDRAREQDLSVADLRTADEAFLTSSLMEVVPLRQIGTTRIPLGPVAKEILARLRTG